MKMALLVAVAAFAAPAFAQTSMPPAADPSATTAPVGQSTTTAPPTDQAMPMATPTAPASAASGDAMPAPSTGKLPICRKGQYTACRERENAKGEGLSKT